MTIAQLAQKKIGAVLDRAVAQRVHPDADRQAGERIVVFGTRQHRRLIAQPPDVAEKSENQQRACADGDGDLCAGEPHAAAKFIRVATYGKITSGEARKDMYERGVRRRRRESRSLLGLRPRRNDKSLGGVTTKKDTAFAESF